MTMWIIIAVIGFILSVLGLSAFVRRYRRGEITRRHLLAAIIGYVSLVTFAVVSAVRPDITNGPLAVIVLLPAFVAIVVLIRERRRA